METILLLLAGKFAVYVAVFWTANRLLNKDDPVSGPTVVGCAFVRLLVGLGLIGGLLVTIGGVHGDPFSGGLICALAAIRVAAWTLIFRLGLHLPWRASTPLAGLATLLNFAIDLLWFGVLSAIGA